MKYFCMIFLCVIALALTQESETDLVRALTQESEIDLVDVSYTKAKKQVSALLQAGNDSNACKDLTKTLSDDVVANVANQQKTLDGMAKGESECDDEGADLVSKAESRLTAANTDHKKKTKELEALQSKTIDFDSFKFSELKEGQCEKFFSQKVWTDAKDAVTKATSDEKVAKSAITLATDAVKDAKKSAKNMVRACRCKAKMLLKTTLKTMNANAKTEHVKAWNQAAHMNCVLDGTPVSKCTVPDLPVVKETTVSEKVRNSCFGSVSAKLGGSKLSSVWTPPRSYEFELAKVDMAEGNDYPQMSRTLCLKLGGMLPVCDNPSYCKDDAAAMYIGQKNHISHGTHMADLSYFPTGWNDIKENFYGTCVYANKANGKNNLCNNNHLGAGNGFTGKGGKPWSSHAWLIPSQTQGTGVDNKPNMGRFSMCAKINHRAYTVKLGAKNGVPAQTVKFQMVTSLDPQGRIDNVHKTACSNIGMKPLCDHPSYCKTDKDTVYIGQTNHFAHSPHRRELTYFPSGWKNFLKDYNAETTGVCAYTGVHGTSAKTLCNTAGDAHAWKTAKEVHEFMCAKVM